jgi:hypothetical protein
VSKICQNSWSVEEGQNEIITHDKQHATDCTNNKGQEEEEEEILKNDKKQKC